MTIEALPDTYGLPEFFVSNVVTEIGGPNVRVVCGVKRGGQIHWLFSYVTRADLLLTHAAEMRGAAEQSLALEQHANELQELQNTHGRGADVGHKESPRRAGH